MYEFSKIYLSYIVPATVLLPLIVGLLNYGVLDRASRMAFFYIVISCLVNTASVIMAEKSINNLPVLHVYTVLELVTVLLFYREAFKRPSVKKIIAGIIILFVVLSVLNSSFIQPLKTHNSYTRSLEAILIIIFCIAFFFTKLDNAQAILPSGALTWINTGWLLYFSSSLFLFIAANLMLKQGNRQINVLIWDIHATLVVLMYVLIAIGFGKCRKA
jgi:hypothetical protein